MVLRSSGPPTNTLIHFVTPGEGIDNLLIGYIPQEAIQANHPTGERDISTYKDCFSWIGGVEVERLSGESHLKLMKKAGLYVIR